MHESNRAERGFAGITKIEISRKVLGELLRVGDRYFAEKIVRMLPVMLWLVAP